MRNCYQPVIIMGMHRSGTSLVAKMLHDLGLFVGWDIDRHYEATFFLDRNEKILNGCGGSWVNAAVVDTLLNDCALRQRVVDMLHNHLISFNVGNYLGLKKFCKYRSAFNLDFAWGWKDPRNTFLLPLWLDIFPGAKIIHVYRNGIDVAQSLSFREVNRIKSFVEQRRFLDQIVTRQRNMISNQGFLLYAIRKVRKMYKKINPLEKYRKIQICSCVLLEKGFDLWCNYIARAFDNLGRIENNVLEICYEDLLVKPEAYCVKLQRFCRLPENYKEVQPVVANINCDRRFAFRDNATLMKFYDTVKDNYWMRKLGYDFVNPESS